MLSTEQTEALRERLLAHRRQLVSSAVSAIGFSMDRDRDRVGRDSLDESTEEAMYSTQLRLHDRETFLLTRSTRPWSGSRKASSTSARSAVTRSASSA